MGMKMISLCELMVSFARSFRLVYASTSGKIAVERILVAVVHILQSFTSYRHPRPVPPTWPSHIIYSPFSPLASTFPD